MTNTDSQLQVTPAPLSAATSLLEVFSPRRGKLPHADRWPDARQALWDSDAIHRANNLAQMATSLSRIDPTRLGLHADALIASDAETLASTYAELGSTSDASALVPCAMLLERISTTLIALFCDGSTLHLRFQAHDVFLRPDRRRAVILIASEFLINALKYAFRDARGGVVHVSLRALEEMGELVVEDDGIGLTGSELPGTGSGLVAAMSGLLDGKFERGNRVGGGARCSVTFPLDIAKPGSCSCLPPVGIDRVVSPGTPKGV